MSKKLLESEIVLVRAVMVQGSNGWYPVSWHIRANPAAKSRSFASYGADAEKYEFPVSKLPKAVQSFVANHKVRKTIVNDRLSCLYE